MLLTSKHPIFPVEKFLKFLTQKTLKVCKAPRKEFERQTHTHKHIFFIGTYTLIIDSNHITYSLNFCHILVFLLYLGTLVVIFVSFHGDSPNLEPAGST